MSDEYGIVVTASRISDGWGGFSGWWFSAADLGGTWSGGGFSIPDIGTVPVEEPEIVVTATVISAFEWAGIEINDAALESWWSNAAFIAEGQFEDNLAYLAQMGVGPADLAPASIAAAAAVTAVAALDAAIDGAIGATYGVFGYDYIVPH